DPALCGTPCQSSACAPTPKAPMPGDACSTCVASATSDSPPGKCSGLYPGGVELRHRIRGVQNSNEKSDPMILSTFQSSLQAHVMTGTGASAMYRPDNEFMYDAFWTSVYATIAVGKASAPTGSQIAGGILSLIDVGSPQIAVGGLNYENGKQKLLNS